MKRILKTLMFFITLVISLLVLPISFDSQQLETNGYIQEVKQETIVLVSNNILGGEISSYQEENSSNYLGNSPFTIAFESKKSLFNKNITQLDGCFIHNLSTNLKKIQPIRAP